MTNRFQRSLERSVLAAMNTAVALSLAIHPAQAQTFKVLYSFGGGADGYSPQSAPLVANGMIYGTTHAGGGAGGYGTVFSLSAQTGKLTTLHTFTGVPDGQSPTSTSLIADSAGNLYGVTAAGGSDDDGIVYRIDATGAMSVLHSFTLTDGASPAALTSDGAGNLYGATGAGTGREGVGTLFKLDAQGDLTTLYTFNATQGGYFPDCWVQLQAGKLYGTNAWGGLRNNGTVFEADLNTDTVKTLYEFRGMFHGGSNRHYIGGIVADGVGHLYGETPYGGQGRRHGYGVVFKLNIATGRETVVHAFAGKPDGAIPIGSLVRDSAGNLFGTTVHGGTHNLGTVFKIDVNNHFSIIHSFAGGKEGRTPAGVTIDSAGNLYGVTAFGGTGCPTTGCGTVFTIAP